MPQSTLISPRPIAARSASTFSTSGCTLKLPGTVVMRSARRLISASGSAVSAASVHLRFRNGAQSTAYLLLKLVSTGSPVCLPASSAARNSLTMLSGPSAGSTPCATSLSPYRRARAGVLGDLLVHQRLRQARRVLLVVAELAEADDVDHHVLVELLAVVQRQLGAQHHGLGVVAVDVQHRRFDHLDHVGAVQRGAGVARVAGGEADLVVDDQVHRAAGVVAARLRQRQRLHHHALAGEGGVAVHQHRQHLVAFLVAAAVHARLDRALDHRVDDLQVAGVEGQAQVHRAARRA